MHGLHPPATPPQPVTSTTHPIHSSPPPRQKKNAHERSYPPLQYSRSPLLIHLPRIPLHSFNFEPPFLSSHASRNRPPKSNRLTSSSTAVPATNPQQHTAAAVTPHWGPLAAISLPSPAGAAGDEGRVPSSCWAGGQSGCVHNSRRGWMSDWEVKCSAEKLEWEFGVNRASEGWWA
ncbi:hypothetical protein EX30DRAFT_339909 [Ascodesmis nigricans]|uniref:Uncharacterized protein n=1 Tax=Ascodesmis nigricans TaxID=341454 RepID=A0A4S2N0K8_9PEZI|nr:hypothetical protein EX30DRAFT_339909 [Ascodesmis nigricans]